MTKYESVLTQALALAEDEREVLAIRLRLSLSPHSPADERALIAELDQISRDADAHPETLLEWADADREIFGSAADS